MGSQFYASTELQTLARVAEALNAQVVMQSGDEVSFSGEVHAVDCNGERLGVFYSIGDGWDFYPTGQLPDHREVPTDEKAAIERLREIAFSGKGLTNTELLDLIPIKED